MDYLKAVLLAVFIHILAPVIVHYVEQKLNDNCVYETHNGTEVTSGSRR